MSGASIELIETKNIELFLPVMREIDLGDRFLLSVLHWCGFGVRTTPLELWRVFLMGHENQIVGVCGMYREPGTPASICWVGWFGVRPQFRNRGFGASAMSGLIDIVQNLGFKEFWVYTNASDEVAIRFYQSQGFEIVGKAVQFAPRQTSDNSDVALKRMLS